MKIGFIGTGTIATSMVEGLMKSKLPVEQITVSPRNAEYAARLAKLYEKVTIGKDNQDVIDQSDDVFICLRSEIAEEELKKLDFSKTEMVVSVIAMATASQLEKWIGKKVYRAVPLPFVEQAKSVTAIYPDHPKLKEIFNAMGGAIAVKDENQFAVMMTAGSLMGVYFNIVETANQWLQKNGLDESQSAPFLASMYGNLADVARQAIMPDFTALEAEYSTKKGTNELVSLYFTDHGGKEALTGGLDEAFKRIKGN